MALMKRLPIILSLLLLVAAPFLASQPATGGAMVRDDRLYTLENPHVVNPVPVSELVAAPFQPAHDLGLWRPLTTLSLRCEFWLSERLGMPFDATSAPLPHLTNALLAALAALAFLWLARGLQIPIWLALTTAAIFTLHPARSEALLWSSGRAELLMTLGALLALAAAASPARGWPLALTLLGATIAFASKEQGAVLVLLVACVPGAPRRARITRSLAVLLWLGALFLWRLEVLGGLGPQGSQQVLFGLDARERITFAIEAFGDYLRLLLVPIDLRHEYDDPSGGSPSIVAMLPALVFLTLGLVAAAARAGRLTFALLLLAIPLGPVLNLLHVTGESFAERFLALPAAGFALALGITLQKGPRFGPVALGLIALSFAVLTHDRASDWRDEKRLAEALERAAPDSVSAARARAALDLAEAARILDALKRREAVAAAVAPLISDFHLPERVVATLEASNALRTAGSATPEGLGPDVQLLRQAVELARAATEAVPDLAEAWRALGLALATTRQHAEAIEALSRAIALEPRDVNAIFGLDALLLRFGREKEAQGRIETALATLDEAAARRRHDAMLPLVIARLALRLRDVDGALERIGRSIARTRGPRELLAAGGLEQQLLGAHRTESERVAAAERHLATLDAWQGETRITRDLEIARGEFLVALGRRAEARQAFEAARAASHSDADRDQLTERLSALDRPRISPPR